MSGEIIGFDFSGNSISIVLVVYGRGEYRITDCEQIPLENGDDWSGVAEAIARIQEEVDMRDVMCVAALPDDWISHRIITMPFADRKKISRIIAYEMEPLLPFSTEDIIIDFQPMTSSRTTADGIDFFSAVVSRTRLKDFIEKINSLGLDPEVITSRGFACTSVLSAYNKDGLFVDGDERRLIAGGFSGGKLRFIHPITTGKQNKHQARSVAGALTHILLADEERQQTDFSPDIVYVTDRLSQQAGLKEDIQSSLDIKVTGINIGDTSGLIAGRVPDGFDVSLCLAMLKQANRPFINFRKDEFEVTGKWRQYSDIILKTGLIAAVVIIVGLSGFYYDLKTSREQIASIYTRRVDVFKESFPKVPLVDDPLIQMQAESERLKGKIGLPPEMARKAHCIDILNDISRLVPDGNDVVIERLVVGSDDVMLSGNTDSFNAVDTLKSEFGKSDFFGKIDISSATMSKIDKRVNFKLRLALL